MAEYVDLQIRIFIQTGNVYTNEVKGRVADVYVKRDNRVTLFNNIALNLIPQVIQTFLYNPGNEVEDFPEL